MAPVSAGRRGSRPVTEDEMIKAVIFDLDGTITVPVPDFVAIRREIGVPARTDILSHIESLSGEEKGRAEAILARLEDETASANRLNDGARRLLDYIAEKGVVTGVITRNSRRSVDLACERHGIEFDSIIAREDAPPKPDPAAIHRLAAELGFEPKDAMMVGDYLFDIQTGKAAGCTTCLLKNSAIPPFTAYPDYEIDRLEELIPIIEKINGG